MKIQFWNNQTIARVTDCEVYIYTEKDVALRDFILTQEGKVYNNPVDYKQIGFYKETETEIIVFLGEFDWA